MIPIPIPVGSNHTCVATGQAAKLVCCESCALEYVYVLERTVQRSSFSPLFLDEGGAGGRASDRAARALTAALGKACDPVPCPWCGWYQQSMLPAVRRQHRRGLFVAGACAAVGALPLAILGGLLNSLPKLGPALPWPVFLGLVIAVFTAGLLMMLAKFVLAFRHDPNRGDPPVNRLIGRSRAWPRGEFEAAFPNALDGRPG